ncbi:hypothetical protein [Pseudaestuariivita rosea]|uniref:hypothetical protein n=1 Tax=Pseudaestuariivita rosea TaxID=2763263 RepID=UPI001ABADF64|nr:hypothetical protein [Pseudaestuariivita rosea]
MNGQFLESEQKIGRLVKNAFGVDETVTLSRRLWQHFDWLESNGKDMGEWTKKLDIERHSYEGFNITFRGYIEMALVQDEARRHRAGEDVPLFINPHRPL